MLANFDTYACFAAFSRTFNNARLARILDPFFCPDVVAVASGHACIFLVLRMLCKIKVRESEVPQLAHENVCAACFVNCS